MAGRDAAPATSGAGEGSQRPEHIVPPILRKSMDKPSDVGQFRSHYCEASTAVQAAALEHATAAVQSLQNGQLRTQFDCAAAIVEAMKGQFPGTWHCIVGRSFGSFVSHESGTMLMFSLGDTYVMLFKHG